MSTIGISFEEYLDIFKLKLLTNKLMEAEDILSIKRDDYKIEAFYEKNNEISLMVAIYVYAKKDVPYHLLECYEDNSDAPEELYRLI